MAELIYDRTIGAVDKEIEKAWDYIWHRNDTVYYNRSCEVLGRGREWKRFFFTSLLCPVILYFILAIWSLIKWSLLRSKRVITGQPNQVELPEKVFGKPRAVATASQMSLPWSHRLQQEANKIVCCQNLIGEIIAVFGFLVAMTSFGIYAYEVSDVVPDLEICRAWLISVEWQIDFACNLFFLLYFVLRLAASNRKVWFLTEMYTWVDYFTIPPAFICLAMDRNWSGLRFLRILHIFSIPEVLQYVGLLKSRNEVRLSQLICQLAGVVLVGAGVFHLLENFYVVLENGHSYWKFLYFTIITISTVGYGDIYPVSLCGRIFTCLFIMAVLGLFASSIPDIAGMMGSRFKYGGKFKLESGSHHIIVCGRITHGIAKQILDNCFHNDQEVKNLSVVFISDDDPDLEMESLLKKNFTQVDYLQGDVLNSGDLNRAAIKDAFACLIIADKNTEQTDTEDALNIMRVISIKNVQPTTRVIVQLHHRHHQSYLYNLPAWSAFRGDTVINLSVIKMGFLAMSCQAMGFSTLMTNLLHCYPMSQHRQAHSKEDLETEILDLYNAGFGAKLRVHRMSSFYNDMTFQEAAKHSYTNLDLLLIGLFKRPSFTAYLPGAFAGSGDFVINPSEHARISANHLGIFVANEIAIVERAWLFCKDCHAGIKSAIEVKACGCASQKTDALARPEVDPVRKFWQQSQQIRRSDSSALDSEFPIGKHNNSVRYSKVSLPYMDNEANVARQGSPVISAMGRYHQAPIRTVTEALIANVEGDYRRLASHIVVCILAEEGAPSLCLQELIAPLRSSSIPYSSLRDVILFGNVKFIEAEWNSLAQFPKVHVVQGNATEWKHLELASIRTCSVCVVLSSKNNRSLNDVSDDQRAVLATLNLRSVECGFRVANLTGERRGNNSHLDIVTSMDHDENVRFLEHGDPADTSAVAQTRSYMAGEILVNSFVESLTISTYFNPLAMPLIESFIYGHSHFAQRADHPDIPGNAKEYLRQSCLNLIRIGDGVLAGILSGEPYCDVVTHALEHGAVCLGLFRRFPDPVDEDQADPTVTRRRRCVITAPPRETLVQSDDLVFVFTSTVQKRPSNVIMHKIQLVDYNGLHEREFSEGRLAAQDDWDKIPPSQRFERLMDDMKEDLLKHRASLQAANQKFLQSPYKNAKK